MRGQITQKDFEAYLAGTYMYDKGRDIARREILGGSNAPEIVVVEFLLEINKDLWRGYMDTYRALAR